MNVAYLNKLVGQKIREFRKFNGLSQEDLGKELEINRSTISQIESGNQEITIGFIYTLSEKLNTEINTFLPPWRSIIDDASSVIHLLQKEFEKDNINEDTKNTILDLLNKKPDNDK